MNLEALDKWHKTLTGYIVFAIAELVLAYILASLAIDSGNLFEYALAFIFIFGGGSNIVKAFKTLIHEQRKH